MDGEKLDLEEERNEKVVTGNLGGEWKFFDGGKTFIRESFLNLPFSPVADTCKLVTTYPLNSQGYHSC